MTAKPTMKRRGEIGLSVSQLTKDMKAALIGPLREALKEKDPDIKSYAESEAKKLAETMAMIEKLIKKNKITQEEAKLHLEIQRNATRTVLMTVEGLGVIAVELAIQAALDVVKKAVNAATKFGLI
jgi:hypothetical protein